MFCKHCGTPHESDAQFCTGCGASLSAAPAKSRRKPFIIAISAVCAMALLASGTVLLLQHSQARQEQQAGAALAGQKAQEAARKEELDAVNDNAHRIYTAAGIAMSLLTCYDCPVEDGCYIVESPADIPESFGDGTVTPDAPDALLWCIGDRCAESLESDGFAVCIEDGHVTGALYRSGECVGSYPCRAKVSTAPDYALDADTLGIAASREEKLTGYVDKSRVMCMNTDAKSLYNCLDAALVTLDCEGTDVLAFNGVHLLGDCPELEALAGEYLELPEREEQLIVYIVEGGIVRAVWTTDGTYAGGYPCLAPTQQGTPAAYTLQDAIYDTYE